MALTGKELKRRVLSAAALHGCGMRELRDLLQVYGAERNLAEAMIAGTRDQNRKSLEALSQALHVPTEWFTAEEWWKLIPGASEPIAEETEKRIALTLERELEKKARQSEPTSKRTAKSKRVSRKK